jgi:hypothetical protein
MSGAAGCSGPNLGRRPGRVSGGEVEGGRGSPGDQHFLGKQSLAGTPWAANNGQLLKPSPKNAFALMKAESFPIAVGNHR